MLQLFGWDEAKESYLLMAQRAQLLLKGDIREARRTKAFVTFSAEKAFIFETTSD